MEERLRRLQRELPPIPVPLLEPIATIYTKLDSIGEKLTTVSEGQATLQGGINALLAKEGVPMIGETTQIKFHETLQPLTGIRVSEECPFNATITSIAFHFPDGCDGLVDVMVGHGHKQCFPRNGYISLNDATPVFATSEFVNKSELTWAEIRNADAATPHTISVVLTLQGRMD